MKRRRRNSRFVLELLGGDPRRCGSENADAGLGEYLCDRVGGRRLSRTRETDDADDPVPAGHHLAHHRFLLVGQADPVGPLDLFEPLFRERGLSCVAAALDERQRGPFDRDELRGRVSGRPPRGGRLADAHDGVAFCSGSYPSPTTPSTACVSLRTFATTRGTGRRGGSSPLRFASTASSGCCSTAQARPAASIIAAAERASPRWTPCTTSPHPDGQRPNHSDEVASSIR